MTQVLIVDDNRAALLMLRSALEPLGVEVLEAGDGAEALRTIKQHSCRIVISDWEMPGMNGLELCRALRAGATGDYVYVILLTARESSAERVEGLSAGADDFVAKPFDPAELRARVGVADRVLSLQTRDVALFALARLAESRDSETGAHLERVQSYARALAQRLATSSQYHDQIDGEFIRLVYSTTPLHDIGKVAIPDTILLKPGRLSDREFEIMKSHTTIGAETLDAALRKFPSARFLRMARDIAASHHERFDGTGYPRGLKGREIPLPARIVSLADVYDALVSKRVYKAAMAHEVARAIIEGESGSHFDPEIVKAFVSCEAEFAQIKDRFEGDQRLAA